MSCKQAIRSLKVGHREEEDQTVNKHEDRGDYQGIEQKAAGQNVKIKDAGKEMDSRWTETVAGRCSLRDR